MIQSSSVCVGTWYPSLKRVGNGLLALIFCPAAELIMKKYYVSSGPVAWTLLAKNPDAAALRFLYLTLQPAFTQGWQDVSEYQMVDWQRAKELASRFANRITVGEQGFSPRACSSLPTTRCIQKWKQQIRAVEQLIRQSK